MGKNKNRNKSTTQNTQPIRQTPISPVKPILTDEQKIEIELKHEELQSVDPVEQLTPESESKLKESETKDDLSKYWSFVKDINKRLESLVLSTKDEKEKTDKLKEEVESSKKEWDVKNIRLIKNIEEYNKKDKEISDRESAIENGEYTLVIRRLLDTLQESKEKVYAETAILIKDITEFHGKNLEDFSKHLNSTANFEKQQIELNREKKKFELDKQIFEEDLKEEFELKYNVEINSKTKELERLQLRTARLEQDNAKLKQLFEDLQNTFESTEPKEILTRHSLLTREFEKLKKERDERPEQFELDNKQAKIEELQAKVTEYQSKINEGELLELKRILSNMDSYVIEINAYKNQIESAKVREASLIKTKDDLLITIGQLKGESTKKEDAFEFAKNCDADTSNLGFNHLQQKKEAPANLVELTSHVQQLMAFNTEENFLYSLDTVRIFLAGLHMSPISILQGISGTGKTSLPREFAKALISDGYYIGEDDDKQNKAPYRICAVQSGWRDNMDLMGYYNSFEQKYKETDFFKALYTANQPKYSDTLFLIILDEMNLSRPEHYFADFLSLLEQSESERYIGLSNTPNEVLPDLIRGGKLKIPENVRFIGTANHDETTLEFAPKTYDRSNLMEMPKHLPEIKEFKKSDKSFNVKYSWLSKMFNEAEVNFANEVKKFNIFTNSDGFKKLLMDKGIGTGNRFDKQSRRFISVFLGSGPEPDKSLATAADHLISSRLLRTLKNRYDLDKANMTNFRDNYVKLFNKSFNQQPNFAIELLDTEISKK